MMSWGRENARMNSWSSPGLFHYDSADLPFSPPSGDAGYLESGLPIWKMSTISEMENALTVPDQSNSSKDQFLSPLFKLLSTHNRSIENVSIGVNDQSSVPLPPQSTCATEMRRMSKSLPATPLSTPAPTPYATPSPTPYSTPAPTPQTSPMLPRKNETEPVRKTSFRRNQGLTNDQPSQNLKWFYLGFMPQGSEISKTDGSTNVLNKESTNSNENSTIFKKIDEDSVLKVPSVSANMNSQPCRRRCAPLISNRDMNFLAPTSM